MDFDCNSNYTQQNNSFESKRPLFLRFIRRIKAKIHLYEVENLTPTELKNEDEMELRKIKANVAIMQKMLSDLSAPESSNLEHYTSVKNEFEKIDEQLKLVVCKYEKSEIQENLSLTNTDHENTSMAQDLHTDSSKHILITPVSPPLTPPTEMLQNEALKTEQITPPTPLTEEEETVLWIEGLRKRKMLKKSNSSAKNNSEESGDEEEAELLRQQHLQDELAGSLVSMAGVLKSNTMAFGDALHKDEQVLDEAQASLDSNLDKLTAEGRRLALLNASTSRSTLIYYLAVIFVILIFLMTAIFIRITAKRVTIK